MNAVRQPTHIMHEVALVRAMIEEVEQQAIARRARRVSWLKIRFNALTSHSADHVRFSFDISKQERPLLQNAELQLHELEPLLRCRCGHEFTGHHLPDVCPRCGSLEVKAVHDTGLVLEGFGFED